MASSNPYLNDDEDADILSDDSATKAPGVNHSVNSFVPTNRLSPEARKAIANYFGKDEDDLDSVMVSDKESAARQASIRGILSMFADWSSFQKQGTVMLAIAEVLDEITDGQVSLMCKLKDTERKILYCHSIKKFFLRIHTVIEPLYDESDLRQRRYFDELYEWFKPLTEIYDFVLSESTQMYYALCIKCGKEPDEHFVENGVYSQRTYFQDRLFGSPPALVDLS